MRWLSLVAALGAGIPHVARAQDSLPAGVARALTQRWPDWRFATLRPELERSLGAGMRAHGLSPAWVSGDFNGDGRRDYAVQIVLPQLPRDSQQQVVALLARGRGYRILPVLAMQRSPEWYLAPEPRGQRVANLDEDGEGDVRVRLPHDGFDVLYDEQAGSTCYLVRTRFRTRFRCILSGD